jgi:hemoglobin-like flavoprotein
MAEVSPTAAAVARPSSSGYGQNEAAEFERRKATIQKSWRAVQFGLDVESIKRFYDRLFDQYPQVRHMFRDDMKIQYRKLYSVITLAVRSLDDMDALVPVLEDLGRKHARYGVLRPHYAAVCDCFLHIMNEYIFSQMPGNFAVQYAMEIQDSWEWVLTFIGEIMADAADEVKAEEDS